MKLLNAFSLNMVGAAYALIEMVEITLDEAKTIATNGVESCVGHADTANVFAKELDVCVVPNRATVALNVGDEVLVGQYSGPRLPEGCMSLPEGATIKWVTVKILH